ncbi:MAG: EF-hand domain-containing protein [Phycisphaerales bacterium]|nr:EF-hand domain-containing protein [Phycisphaerales bacterium]
MKLVQLIGVMLATLVFAAGPARAQELEWRRRIIGPAGGGSMVYDAARDATVLLGGPNGADTWEWDGALWKKCSGSGPAAAHNAMVYDSARGVTVLFDGMDTWEREGSTWTKREVTCPPFRSGHAMVYDSARRVTVLFGGTGGRGGPVPRSDTWEWDGAAWTLRATAGPARMYHAMAYDPKRGVTVAFGGASGWPTAMGGTSEWDGTTWKERFVAEPPPRWDHAMTYDPARGVIVLFGGTHIGTIPGSMNDTWEWDGTAWTERLVSGPSGMSEPPVLAYDIAREVAVLEKNNDTRELGAGGWVQRMASDPTGLRSYRLVYDAARRSTVLFGELQYGVQQMLEWDGEKWLPLSADGMPNGLFKGWTYDAARDVVVVIATRDAGGGPDDTWEWDGTEWTRRAAGATNLSGQLVYDAARGVCVRLAAYSLGSGVYQAQTVEWDGATWTLRPVSTPLRLDHAIAYDSARHVTVVFGGRNPETGEVANDTWEWDGTSWTRRAADGPPTGGSRRMVYDAARGVTLLLISGVAGGSQTWEWDGWNWTQRMFPGLSDGSGTLAYDAARNTTVLFRGDAGTWELACAADINHDGAVDCADYLAFLDSFEATDLKADLDGDGLIDFSDYLEFLNHFDAGC